jgi:hypothetical protein
MEHFILGCRCLETVRNPVLHELVTKLKECDVDFWQLNEMKKMQLILDSTSIHFLDTASFTVRVHFVLLSGSSR